ncbi:MAG: peptide chain release factor 2 [Helicobacter sp.]|nr:peptide chain release factor 2 [Helicobacter sp.]
MDSYTYSELLKELSQKLLNIAQIIQPDAINSRLDEIAKLEENPNFWNDPKHSKEISQEKSKISRLLNQYQEAKSALEDASELYEISQDDESTLNELFSEAKSLEDLITNVEISTMLSDKNDQNNAILTIQPGAGGTESQDWSAMLYRMYLRFCEREGFKYEVLDYQNGDEAGIKGAAILIKGQNAYGFLKLESGVHRLVRNSPFDAANKRHTSFSSVQVTPDLDDDIQIIIEDKDIRIDTYRASGAGGQHVNKTESAIRITHIPTGIITQCQNDRSQHKNKAQALKMLKSKLYNLELQKQNEQNTTQKSDIAWGHQIRSYVLSPYQQVKDMRSNLAYSNVVGILDGDILSIITGVLIATRSNSKEAL